MFTVLASRQRIEVEQRSSSGIVFEKKIASEMLGGSAFDRVPGQTSEFEVLESLANK